MAQVYVHNTRIPPAHFSEMATRGGYYESSGIQLEPPPAHRAAASISVVVPPPPNVASASPYISGGASVSVSVQPGPHSLHPSQAKILEREREQRERERENERLSMVAAVGTYTKAKLLDRPMTHFVSLRFIAAKQQQEHLSASVMHGGMELPAQPPPAAMAPPPGDSLVTLLQRYPVMWQGLLALKTDQAAVQMHFVHGNPNVARASLPSMAESTTPQLRIAQRMRLEQTQLEGVAKKMQVRTLNTLNHIDQLITNYCIMHRW